CPPRILPGDVCFFGVTGMDDETVPVPPRLVFPERRFAGEEVALERRVRTVGPDEHRVRMVRVVGMVEHRDPFPDDLQPVDRLPIAPVVEPLPRLSEVARLAALAG